MVIGFTGTRKGISSKQEMAIRKYFYNLQESEQDVLEFHHGCCVGSDANFHTLVRQIFPDCRIIGHPPISPSFVAENLEYDDVFRPFDYLVRNRHIVDSCEILLATPEGEEILRSGTWATIRYALKKADKTVLIFR